VVSNSNSYAGGGIGVYGNGKVLGLRYVRALPSEEPPAKFSQLMTLGLDYKNYTQDLALIDGSALSTPIHYAPFLLNYSGLRSDENGVTEFGAGMSFALRGVASDAKEFADKRYQALGNYLILKFTAGRTQKLPLDLSLYSRVDAQLASQPLVSNEQYVAGGVDSVRGYLEATQAGDSAVRGTFELRSANLWPQEERVELLQWRVFIDGAYLRLLSPLPGTRDNFELVGVGVGLTLRAKSGLSARADLAWPLRASSYQQAYRPLVQANAVYEF
jgi:hemolysin activation/secretion protein